jgi:hypothetical protein
VDGLAAAGPAAIFIATKAMLVMGQDW